MQRNFVIAGVGGQGVLLAASVLGEAAMAAGHDTRIGEMHGMSQRGGSVIAHVRYGPRIDAPLVPKGKANAVIALEPMEALRYASYLEPDGVVLTSVETVPPLAVERGDETYPEEAVLEAELERHGTLVRIDAPSLARKAGTPKAANVVVIGAASSTLDLGLDVETLREAIDEQVPETAREANRRAFELGRRAGTDTVTPRQRNPE